MGLFEKKNTKKQTGTEHGPEKTDAGNTKKTEEKQAKAAERKAVKEAKRREAKYAAAAKKAARDERKEREAAERRRKEAEKAAQKAREEAEKKRKEAEEEERLRREEEDRKRKEAEESERQAREEAEHRAAEEIKRKAVEAAERKTLDEQAWNALDKLFDQGPMTYDNFKVFFEEVIGFRIVTVMGIRLIQLLTSKTERFQCYYSDLTDKQIGKIRDFFWERHKKRSDFYEAPISLSATVRALAFIIPEFEDAQDTTDPITTAFFSQIVSNEQIRLLPDNAFEKMIGIHDYWVKNSPNRLNVTESTHSIVLAAYSQLDNLFQTEMQRRETELDDRAIKALDRLFSYDPLKYAVIREGIVGYRIVSIRAYNSNNDCKGCKTIQLFTAGKPKSILLLHDESIEKDLISIMLYGDSAQQATLRFLKKNSKDLRFNKMPDPINVLRRSFGFLIPEFDSCNYEYGDSGLPYPQKADFTKLVTRKQINLFSDDAFRALNNAHDNWIEDKGAVSTLEISTNLYEEIASAYSQMDSMLKTEKQRRAEENGCSVENDALQQTINAGINGEKEVNYALSWLGPDYKLITFSGNLDENGLARVKLKNPSFRDEAQEYDHIRVGPQGVFVIETKNLAGEIRINEFGKWTRKKKNEPEFRALENNPAAQITRHRKVMESILQDAYPQVNVICIICISNKNAEIDGEEHCKYPVVISDAIVDYIEDYESDTRLSKEETEAVAAHIKSFIVE